MHYTKYSAVLEKYWDVKWILDMKDLKSMSKYVFILSGATMSWKSFKYTCIAQSTIELEFIILDKATEKAEWLKQILEDILR